MDGPSGTKLRKSLDGFDSYDFEAENQAIRNVAANTACAPAPEWRSGNWVLPAPAWAIIPGLRGHRRTPGDALMRYTGGFGSPGTDHLSLTWP